MQENNLFPTDAPIELTIISPPKRKFLLGGDKRKSNI